MIERLRSFKKKLRTGQRPAVAPLNAMHVIEVCEASIMSVTVSMWFRCNTIILIVPHVEDNAKLFMYSQK